MMSLGKNVNYVYVAHPHSAVGQEERAKPARLPVRRRK